MTSVGKSTQHWSLGEQPSPTFNQTFSTLAPHNHRRNRWPTKRMVKFKTSKNKGKGAPKSLKLHFLDVSCSFSVFFLGGKLILFVHCWQFRRLLGSFWWTIAFENTQQCRSLEPLDLKRRGGGTGDTKNWVKISVRHMTRHLGTMYSIGSEYNNFS